MYVPSQRSRGGLLRDRAVPPLHRQGHAQPGALQPEARQQGGRAGRRVGLPAGLPEGAGQAQRAARPLPERQHQDDQEEAEQCHVFVVGNEQVKWQERHDTSVCIVDLKRG